MKNILCYGDSNTWGYTPGTAKRFERDVRWTGVMQNALGPDYHVIEEGLNGRTSCYDDVRNFWRNGREQLPACLISHKPLNLIILSLGTNDLKFTDAFGASKGVESLLSLTQMVQNKPESSRVFPDGVKALVVSPILVGAGIANDLNTTMRNGHEESLKFRACFERMVNLHRSYAFFFDAAEVADPSEKDFMHMEADSHRRLGLALADKVREILG